MVESRDVNNLPMGVMVNRAMVTPKKSKKFPSYLPIQIVIMSGSGNPCWLQCHVEVESCPWDYQTILSHDGKDISVSFCPVPTPGGAGRYFHS